MREVADFDARAVFRNNQERIRASHRREDRGALWTSEARVERAIIGHRDDGTQEVHERR